MYFFNNTVLLLVTQVEAVFATWNRHTSLREQGHRQQLVSSTPRSSRGSVVSPRHVLRPLSPGRLLHNLQQAGDVDVVLCDSAILGTAT